MFGNFNAKKREENKKNDEKTRYNLLVKRSNSLLVHVMGDRLANYVSFYYMQLQNRVKLKARMDFFFLCNAMKEKMQ